MARQKQKTAKAAHGNPVALTRHAAVPKTRALTLLDSSSVRKKAVRECELARKKYDDAAAKWERYQMRDAPEFAHALALCAGPLREEMRVLLPKYEALSDLLQEVEDEMFFSGDGAAECLARIEAKDAESEELDETDTAPHGGGQVSEDEAEVDGLDEDWAEDADVEEAEDASEGDAFDDLLRHLLGMEPRKKSVKPERERADRIKELYRELVRALHPDGGGQITDKRMRLWHEVQAAYRCGDLARLEFLHAQSGQAADLSSRAIPLSRLKALTALFKTSLRKLKRDIRTAKGDPAWGFSALRADERSQKLWAAEAGFQAEVNEVKDRIRRMEEQLEDIRQPKKRSKRGRRHAYVELRDDDVLRGDTLLDILGNSWL